MPQSLTTTATPILPPLFLRLPTKPLPPRLRLLPITKPETNKQPSLALKLGRRERNILNAKEKSFNAEVEVEEDDSLEECLDQFNRKVAATGLLKDCKRRRFYENAREKKKRKEREAALQRRRSRQKQKVSPEQNEEPPIDNETSDFWALSDERFEELIDDKEEGDEEIKSGFQDDGEGTWRLFDGISRT